ncbi:predicted protein [Naegleria gruberi]|uniref:Predicted protein n=1 Tax=Naegleria gruberi TaxID=5762 RepID=D2V0J7_NAEGR|nr:uncharacterized protein NAEGRDRAFT_62318 [Naegleria gruberi]EFC49533.1 predicted protein [Naegleria gruberi]|eukprot:XP_002682277.1 predicted protein [Naegleria gruberi strain NEG-M]
MTTSTDTDSQYSSVVGKEIDDHDEQPTLLDVLLCCCMPSLRPSRLIYSILYPTLNTILNQFGNFKLEKIIRNIVTHPITKFITIHYVKIISVLTYLSISLILSGLGAFFFSLMLLTYYRPPTQFDHPIFFIRNGTTLSANVTLLSHDTSKSLVQNGLYIDTFKVKFNLPESNVNRDIGMFSIHAEFYDRYNSKLYSTSRSVCVKSLNHSQGFSQSILKYKSVMSELVNTVFSLPYALLGKADETETQSVDMLTETQLLEFNSRVVQRASHVYVWLSHDNLQIYSSSIQLFARVTGVWHYLYQYPITCFLILFPMAFLSNMSGYLFVGAFLFYKFIYSSGKSNSITTSTITKQSIKQQATSNESSTTSRKKKITTTTVRRKKIIHTSSSDSISDDNDSIDEDINENIENDEQQPSRIDSPSQSSTTSTTKRQAASNKLKKRLKKRIELQDE